MLHPDNREVIAATAGVVADNAVAITSRFYPRMFANNPELLNVFNQANQAIGEQPVALASSIVAYARHLLGADDVPFDRVIERIAHKHVALGIAPGDYTIVGRNLMAAIGETLGEAVTPEVAAAWGEVYWLFAMDLVAAEARLYAERGATPDTICRPHRLVSRHEETPDVVTLRFAPMDGSAARDFEAGQYVSVIADLGDGHRQPRQYTLSGPNHEGALQITVKHVRGGDSTPEGVVSAKLHAAEVGSQWDISAPCGDVRIPADDRPLILASAGIGVTPMAAILGDHAERQQDRTLLHLHWDTSPESIALSNQMRQHLAALPHAEQRLFTGGESVADMAGRDLPQGALAHLCGSIPFMRDVRRELIAAGVAEDAITYEVFGPDMWLGGSVASRATA